MTFLKQLIAAFAVTIMLGNSAAWAGYLSTTSALEIEQQRADVMATITRPDVRELFIQKGVSPEEVEQRIAMLTPTQLNNLQTELNNAPAGQSTFGTLVAAAVVVFIVLLITDIMGETDVFDFDD